jgi:hypothetical protein
LRNYLEFFGFLGEIFWEFFSGIFSEDFFSEEFFGRYFLGGFVWEDFFGRIFLRGFFWEDFLGGFFGEEFFGRNYLVEINKELMFLQDFGEFCLNAQEGRILDP